MELDIDVEKTLDKTRAFLEKDLRKLASLADRDVTSLSSPQLSLVSVMVVRRSQMIF